MSATAIGKHLFVSEQGPTGICETCGKSYEHANHQSSNPDRFRDLHALDEDERIDIIAAEVRKNKIVGVMLEAGIGKVERYISKLASRYPDVRVITRTLKQLNSSQIEMVQFGPKEQA